MLPPRAWSLSCERHHLAQPFPFFSDRAFAHNLDDRPHQRLLVFEVSVQPRLAHLARYDDIVEGCATDTSYAHQVGGRSDDPRQS